MISILLSSILEPSIFWIWTFWGSTALIAYTCFGYVGCIWLRSLCFRKEVQRAPFSPFVSIVLIVRNEERVLARKLENLLTLDYPAQLLQLIVVSDGSTDGTENTLHGYASNPSVNVVLKQLSRGKASGLNDALQVVQGDIVVFTDARQKIDGSALRLLLENFADPEVGCASGELMLGESEARGTAAIGSYWTIEKRIRELESASGSVVGATGAFYAVRRNLLSPLPPETILDDVYLPMQVVRQGFRVVFDSRARAWDNADFGANREFARKVRTLNGNYQLLRLAPWLLTSANPIRFEFISHKLLRLVVPFALVGVLVASIVLRAPIYRFALGLQLMFYALSFVPIVRLKRGPIARMAGVASTFVMLNAAAVVAFANFVSGRKVAWNR
jgi:biofilm PGA synthesis N-glycosyltransferase PgaC